MIDVLAWWREQRAEHDDADRAAEAAEERDQRAAGADVALADGVLHDQHEVLHQHADAGADAASMNAPSSTRLVVSSSVPISAEAGGQQHRAEQHEALVAAGAADEPADDRGGDEQADDHRDRQQAGLGRRLAARDLHVLAEEDGGAEHRDADGDAGDHGEHDGAVGEQAQRDQRLRPRGARRATAATHRRRPMPPTSTAAVCQETQSYCWPASETQISRAETPPAISVAPA